VKPIIRNKLVVILSITLLTASLQSCTAINGGAGGEPTLSELAAAVAQTATAAKSASGSVDSLATAQVKGTQKSVEIAATQTARASSMDASAIAQATLAAPIIAELPQYGLDPSQGRAAWVQGPLQLEIDGYQESTYGNDHMEVTAADFVLAADVTWDTQYGSSGCGFMFRSNGDKEKINQYMVIATRFGGGHVLFTALAEGEIANVHDFYARSEDKSFAWENGSTNRLAIVARDTLIEFYSNYVKIGEVDTTQPPSRLPSPPKPQQPLDTSNIPAMQNYEAQLKEYQEIVNQSESAFQTAVSNYMTREAVFDEGFLAMLAVSESGKTQCTFNDAWLWLIEP